MLLLTDTILVWLICKSIDQMAEGVLAKFPMKTSSHLPLSDYGKPWVNQWEIFVVITAKKLNFYIRFRCMFFHSYFIDETNELNWFFFNHVVVPSNKRRLINKHMPCLFWNCAVIFFFNVCICIYICTGLYIHVTVSLDLDRVLHFTEKLILSSECYEQSIFVHFQLKF